MRIGIDGRNLQEGSWSGVGVYTSHLVRALEQYADDEYTVFSNAMTTIPQSLFGKRIRSVHTRFPNILFHPALRFLKRPRLDKIIGETLGESIDIFFSPNLHFTALSTHIPHVLTIHDLSFELYSECYSLKRRLWHSLVQPKKQCERADAIIVPSAHTKEDIVRLYHIDRKKIHVIYPGVPDVIEDTKETHRIREKYILFIGTIEPRKNIEGMITAYKKSNVLSQGIKLIIAGGSGWKSGKLMELMEKTEGVEYRGYIDDSEKAALYQSALFFLFPSFYEGFGFPVVEAMASGIPVITSDCSSLPEVARGAAFLVSPYATGNLALGIRRLAEDETLRKRLAEEGKKVAEEYSWKKAAEQLSAVFQSLG